MITVGTRHDLRARASSSPPTARRSSASTSTCSTRSRQKLGLKAAVRDGAVRLDHPRRRLRQVRGRRLLVHHQRRPRAAGEHGQLLHRRHPVGDQEGQPDEGRPRQRLRQEDRRPEGDRAGRRHHRPVEEVHDGRASRRSPSTSTTAQDDATAAVVSGKDDADAGRLPGHAPTRSSRPTASSSCSATSTTRRRTATWWPRRTRPSSPQAIADAVKALIADGTYKKVLDKWGVEAGAIDNPSRQPDRRLTGRGHDDRDDDPDRHRPRPIKAVPVRHPGRWVAIAVIALLRRDVRAHAGHEPGVPVARSCSTTCSRPPVLSGVRGRR